MVVFLGSRSVFDCSGRRTVAAGIHSEVGILWGFGTVRAANNTDDKKVFAHPKI